MVTRAGRCADVRARPQAAARPVADAGPGRGHRARRSARASRSSSSMLSTLDSLDLTLRTYYERYRFADVFASLERAPMSLTDEHRRHSRRRPASRRASWPTSRSTCRAWPSRAAGRLISIPDDRRRRALRRVPAQGRLPEAGRRLTRCWPARRSPARTASARAARSAPVINGAGAQLAIVGLALSPEYIYPIRPGELLPDDDAVRRVLDGPPRAGVGVPHGRRLQRRRAHSSCAAHRSRT